jgi:formate dehydrogenase maturation protein FdhE
VVLDATLRSVYGITLAQKISMLKEQRGVCAICGLPPKKACVDHNKDTGQIRGVLCHSCNVAIGLLAHDIERIEAAKNYLIRTQCAP